MLVKLSEAENTSSAPLSPKIDLFEMRRKWRKIIFYATYGVFVMALVFLLQLGLDQWKELQEDLAKLSRLRERNDYPFYEVG